MSKMQTLFSKRTLLVGLLAASGALAASASAMGNNADGKAGCAARYGQHAQVHKEDFRAKRMAGLKDKLKLQPGQEAAWQTFTKTAGSQQINREDRQVKREAFKQMNTPQRLDMMQSKMDQRRAYMSERAEAIKQFYAQLSPEQQSVFDVEARPGRFGQRHRHGADHGHHGKSHQQS
jgi:hypothetical protein